jgi:hypothetical protein
MMREEPFRMLKFVLAGLVVLLVVAYAAYGRDSATEKISACFEEHGATVGESTAFRELYANFEAAGVLPSQGGMKEKVAEAEKERSAEVHFGVETGILLVVNRGEGPETADEFVAWGLTPQYADDSVILWGETPSPEAAAAAEACLE